MRRCLPRVSNLETSEFQITTASFMIPVWLEGCGVARLRHWPESNSWGEGEAAASPVWGLLPVSTTRPGCVLCKHPQSLD